MKIIHTADLHLDSALTAHLLKDKATVRRSELLNNFRRLSVYAAEHDVRAVLISGDLFDTEDVSESAVRAVLDTVKSTPQTDYYYLRGNHDTLKTLVSEELPVNLHLFTEEWTCYELSENIRIYGRELNRANCMTQAEGLTADPDHLNICMLHGQITEGRTLRDEAYIDLKNFRNRNIDYLALGHIHRFSYDNLDSRGVYCYPGPIEGRGFDETGECGFVLLDTTEKEDRLKMEFIPFQLRRIYRIRTDVTGCMSSAEIIERITGSFKDNRIEETAMVSVSLTGKLDVECEKDLSYIRTALLPLCFFLQLSDMTTYISEEEDYRYEESLKGEFVRQVLESGMSEEDKQTVIRYGLQALKNEEIE